MPRQNPTTIAEFLAQLPPDRRKEIQRVRQVVRKHLPAGYRETMTRGMIVYEVPLRRYPDTYNGQPLWYAALAAQKGHLTLHLLGVYGSPALQRQLQDGFKAAGKKLDMGKACIHFRTADDLPLDLIGSVVASIPLDRFVAIAKAARGR